MDIRERRQYLVPAANPGGGRDYVITLRGRLILPDHGELAAITVRYVPDRHILARETFESYLTALQALPWDSLEAIAVAIVGDISNELVSRWAEVTLRQEGGDSLPGHEINVEDRQPGWRNDDLLYRLPPV